MTFFNFIEAEYANQPGRPAMAVALRNLPVSRAGFYAWRKRPESAHARDENAQRGGRICEGEKEIAEEQIQRKR